jgi:Uncharacterised nucleotidyltransferase
VSHAPATSIGTSAATASVGREWDLLLAAVSVDREENGPARIRTLLQRGVDWDAVLRLADQHGITSLLYQSCSKLNDALPSAAQAMLGVRHDKNVHQSLFLARELVRILDCLEALGIGTIPYKGLALSEIYYGDMAMRQSGDMDLFVRKQDVARVTAAVYELGYTPRLQIADAAWQDYLASGYEWTFDSPAGKNLLELQWALQPHFYAVDYDMEGLFERAVNGTVAGRRVKTPSVEDLLLVLAVHAAKHVWGRLIWLCDLAQILKRENLDWDWVQSRAQEYGIERILRISLLLANRFLGQPIPGPLENATLADPVARGYGDEIAAAVVGGVSYEEQQVFYYRLMMRLRERRMDRVRFLARLTFTPGPGEWEAMRLPGILFPLYRVVRMARLAARLARK